MKHFATVYISTLVLVVLLDLFLLYNNHKQRKQNDSQTAIQKSNYTDSNGIRYDESRGSAAKTDTSGKIEVEF
ncbi:MAG: hypothetical protein LBF05_07550 [Tannerella sp.]|nr:hypothetical protein [Tannerella sp.]